MNPTRELITDLLPTYFSGEASADTQAFVEEFFAQDPEFEQLARRLAGSLNALKQPVPGDEEAAEKRALTRTRMELQGKNISLGVVLAGIVGIVVLVAMDGETHSKTTGGYGFLVVACVAIFALLATRTRNTGV
jgi:ferric-dicitrate binding protein FerR (iron transport regulator)